MNVKAISRQSFADRADVVWADVDKVRDTMRVSKLQFSPASIVIFIQQHCFSENATNGFLVFGWQVNNESGWQFEQDYGAPRIRHLVYKTFFDPDYVGRRLKPHYSSNFQSQQAEGNPFWVLDVSDDEALFYTLLEQCSCL